MAKMKTPFRDMSKKEFDRCVTSRMRSFERSLLRVAATCPAESRLKVIQQIPFSAKDIKE